MRQSVSKSRKRAASGLTIGRRAFARISAVEGIHLSRDMERELDEFDRQKLSAEGRRQAIAKKYGKAR